MKRFGFLGPMLAGAVLTGMVACAALTTAVVDGQLFCAVAGGPTGSIVVALADAAGVPLVVTNKAAAAVKAACAVINGIPVSPPSNPTTAPKVASPAKL